MVSGALAFPANPTAAQILDGWKKYAGLTERNTRVSAATFTVVTHGVSFVRTVIAMAPNRVLLENSIPDQGITEVYGYDGKHAWWADAPMAPGAAGPSDTSDILSSVAYYNYAILFRNRWKTKPVRVGDARILGVSYYAIHDNAYGGHPSDSMLFNKHTFMLVGLSFGDSARICTKIQRRSGIAYCATSIMVEKNKPVGISTNRLLDARFVEAWQFDAPETPYDSTTSWLLARYGAAIHRDLVPQTQMLAGSTTAYSNADGHREWSHEWSLRTERPTSYNLVEARSSGETATAAFDGTVGAYKTFAGVRADATFEFSVDGMAYNHCELFSDKCGVWVTRTPNVRIGAETFYTLKVTSRTNPAAWYTVYLDPRTFLPRQLGFAHDIQVHLDDYRVGPTGALFPSTWTYYFFLFHSNLTDVRVL